MKSIEFALDLPYIENIKNVKSIMDSTGCELNEATRIDYQQNWKKKRRMFALQTRCMTAFFERLLSSNVNIGDCEKILVECVPQITYESVKSFSGVYTVSVILNYDSFEKENDLNKKKIALELLMRGIRQVANKKKWDIVEFENINTQILEAQYKNEWVWKKSVKSPDKKAFANVLLQHEVSEIKIIIAVIDNNKSEILRKQVLSELPDEFAYASHLGSLQWISNKKIVLINKKKDREWLVTL